MPGTTRGYSEATDVRAARLLAIALLLAVLFIVWPSPTVHAQQTGYAERAGDPSLKVRWLSLGLGVGHPLTPPRLRTLCVQLACL